MHPHPHTLLAHVFFCVCSDGRVHPKGQGGRGARGGAGAEFDGVSDLPGNHNHPAPSAALEENGEVEGEFQTALAESTSTRAPTAVAGDDAGEAKHGANGGGRDGAAAAAVRQTTINRGLSPDALMPEGKGGQSREAIACQIVDGMVAASKRTAEPASAPQGAVGDSMLKFAAVGPRRGQCAPGEADGDSRGGRGELVIAHCHIQYRTLTIIVYNSTPLSVACLAHSGVSHNNEGRGVVAARGRLSNPGTLHMSRLDIIDGVEKEATPAGKSPHTECTSQKGNCEGERRWAPREGRGTPAVAAPAATGGSMISEGYRGHRDNKCGIAERHRVVGGAALPRRGRMDWPGDMDDRSDTLISEPRGGGRWHGGEAAAPDGASGGMAAPPGMLSRMGTTRSRGWGGTVQAGGARHPFPSVPAAANPGRFHS